jgi:hypothetical protein
MDIKEFELKIIRFTTSDLVDFLRRKQFLQNISIVAKNVFPTVHRLVSNEIDTVEPGDA